MRESNAHPVDDLKIIRFNTQGINEPDAPYADAYPYKLTVNLQPPAFMQVAFIGLYGGSEELIVRGTTRGTLDRFIASNNFTEHPRLRSLLITGPDGMHEEICR